MNKILIFFTSCFIYCLLFSTLLSAQSTDSTVVDQGVYEGKIKKSLRHGYGTCTWEDGRKYIGKWKDNLMSGKGTMNYSNGDQYIGDWERGVKQGYGTYTWKNGSSYVGSFKNGQKSGWGILKFADGGKHEGYWVKDMAHGKGKHIWANGLQYYGDWKRNKRDGSGVLEYPDRSVVQGEWKNDVYQPCECTVDIDTFTTEELYGSYDAIFVGTVKEIYQENDDTDAVVFEITQYWKGAHGFERQITIHAGFKSCDMIFYENTSYLIFASKGFGSKYYKAYKCSPTGEARFKAPLIAALDKLPCQGEESKTISVQEFEPVCGCDGKTYNNPFQAKEKGVNFWKKGACKKRK